MTRRVANNWKKAFYLSAVLFVVLLTYCSIYFGAVTANGVLGAIAGTGGFVIGISFGLAPAVRYLHFSARWLKYRREIGIVGYGYALAYSLALIFITPSLYLDDFPMRLLTIPSALGIFAMIVLTIMTLLSNNAARSYIGFTYWKRVMRLGYVAYAALVVRAGILEGHDWLVWLANLDGLPPPRFVLSIFASIVMLARLLQTLHVPDMSQPATE